MIPEKNNFSRLVVNSIILRESSGETEMGLRYCVGIPVGDSIDFWGVAFTPTDRESWDMCVYDHTGNSCDDPAIRGVILEVCRERARAEMWYC